MSRDNPRDDRWAEWYAFHPDVLAVYNEVAGGSPPHEPRCPHDTSRPTRPEESLFPDEFLPVADLDALCFVCWCDVFCGYCDHHASHHTFTGERGSPTLCKRCQGGICPDQLESAAGQAG